MILKSRPSPPPLARLPRKDLCRDADAGAPPPRSTTSTVATVSSWRQGDEDEQSDDDGQGQATSMKCVLVGDGAVGKTSLVVSYTTNGYPTEYEPTAFDNYTVLVTVDNIPVRLQLCDTAGQDDFDALRPLCYPNTDIFLICFSVVVPASFHNVMEKWVPELRAASAGTPLILIGTQSDLRDDVRELIQLARYSERPISEAQAREAARTIGAVRYIECSALTQLNLKQVFDTAILAALEKRGMLAGGSTVATATSKTTARGKRKAWRRLCCL